METFLIIAACLAPIFLLIAIAYQFEKRKKRIREKELEHVLTYGDLLSWQYSQNLEDKWLVAVNGATSSEVKTLLQAKEIKENAHTMDIQVLHESQREAPEAEWKYLHVTPKDLSLLKSIADLKDEIIAVKWILIYIAISLILIRWLLGA